MFINWDKFILPLTTILVS